MLLYTIPLEYNSMSIIYCLSCLDTGKKYIGSTRKDLDWRVGIHYSHAKTLNTKLYNAMKQYRFVYGLVEECEEDKRYEREAYWVKKFDTLKNGYNSRMPRGDKTFRKNYYERKDMSDMNINDNYMRRKYRLYAPDGQAYDTSSMGVAATLLGLNKASLCRVAKGERKQCYGWTAEIF